MLTVGWTLCTAVLLLAPGGAASGTDWLFWVESHGGDKIIHALLLFVEAVLVAKSAALRVSRRSSVAIGTLVALLFGAGLEFSQLGIPGRTATWGDLLANAVGAMLFPCLYLLRRRWGRERMGVKAPPARHQ